MQSWAADPKCMPVSHHCVFCSTGALAKYLKIFMVTNIVDLLVIWPIKKLLTNWKSSAHANYGICSCANAPSLLICKSPSSGEWTWTCGNKNRNACINRKPPLSPQLLRYIRDFQFVCLTWPTMRQKCFTQVVFLLFLVPLLTLIHHMHSRKDKNFNTGYEQESPSTKSISLFDAVTYHKTLKAKGMNDSLCTTVSALQVSEDR